MLYLGKTQRNGVGTDLTLEWSNAMNGIADKEIQGLVNMMKSMKNQGYKFGAFIDLYPYDSARVKMFDVNLILSDRSMYTG